MESHDRDNGKYLNHISRYFSCFFVVVLFGVLGNKTAWCSLNPPTLVEGYPGCQSKIPEALDSTITPWPRECDRFCQGTSGCLSFTWSPQDSSCQAFDETISGCYQKKEKIFWIAKTFAQSKEEFENYVTLTESNNYGGQASDQSAPEVEEKDACVSGAAPATWSNAKNYCESQGMLLYSPKNPDELTSMVHCSNMDSELWTGYRRDELNTAVFRSDRLMILGTDNLLEPSGSGDCLAGDNQGQNVQPNSCDATLKFICQPEYHSEFCEKSGNVATVSELVPNSNGVFISRTPCVSRNAQVVGESAIDSFGGARSAIVNKCKDVRESSTCDVFVNDADGYEKCIVVKEDGIENCAASEKFYLCRTTVFASSQRVKFDDAEQVCVMNGGQIVDPADATDDEMEPILKAVSCSWSMTQTSDIEKVIIYENGNDPEVRLRTDSNGEKYNFYDVAICKLTAE